MASCTRQAKCVLLQANGKEKLSPEGDTWELGSTAGNAVTIKKVLEVMVELIKIW